MMITPFAIIFAFHERFHEILQGTGYTVECKQRITGLILAGGRATRMGGQDKGLVEINRQPMIAYVIHALRPQVSEILINANRNHGEYRKFGHPLVTDELAGFQGPLAGMAAALNQVSTDYLFTCPCDGPLLPADVVARLYQALSEQDAEICVAHDGDRLQPVCALIDCRLRDSLFAYLGGEDRKIEHWYRNHRLTEADFSDKKHCFQNANRPQDLDALSRYLKGC